MLIGLRSCLVCRGRYDRRVMIALESDSGRDGAGYDGRETPTAGRGRRLFVCNRPECAESRTLPGRASHVLGTPVTLDDLVTMRHGRNRAECTGGERLG